jgi:hypothetical protein
MQAGFNSATKQYDGYILSGNELQQLPLKERSEIESHLCNYNIPLQILQMVAERCGCTFDSRISGRDFARKPKLPVLLARLNDRSIMMLQQIFIDCQDSHSNFRFAVFLSSRYSPMIHKFVMDRKIAGKSGLEYFFDVCIYSRQTEELVAVGMQNNNTRRQASGRKSLREFRNAAADLKNAHPEMKGAYYASSYGYENDDSKRQKELHDSKNKWEITMEIKFFEYRDQIYVEKKLSQTTK